MNRRKLVVTTALVITLVVLAVTRIFGGSPIYTVDLPDAAGIRPGDDVRVAGINVGKVKTLAAEGAKVVVTIALQDDVKVTTGTRTEVKLSSLLGQRYLELQPGPGDRLKEGDTLPLANANGSYTIERFWMDSGPALTDLNLKTLSRAVDVLSTDLAVSPKSSRDALTGMASVAGLVTRRNTQIGQLLSTTRKVTDEVVAQRTQLSSLMTNANQVLAMVVQRKQAIETLIRGSEVLARELSSLARTNAKPMASALTQLRTILTVLRSHRDDLAATLQLAAPAMRLYVNSSGDGPWLGVNAPYFIMPDSFWCQTRKDIGCH